MHGSREVLLKYYITGSLKLFQNCHGKTHPILLKDVDLCLEISSDFNYNFGFVVEEIVELGILKNLDVSTLDTRRIIEVGAL